MSEGFGENKQTAIKLLKSTIDILNDFNINHFLISGTLLGYVRHNDFIPWDDDIDILVDESILDYLDIISQKYKDINIFYIKKQKYNCIKFCFKDGIEIPKNENSEIWIKNSLSTSNKYCWPFVDLFIYENGPGVHNCLGDIKEEIIDNVKVELVNPNSGKCSESFRLFPKSEISFFHNEYTRSEFFPPKKVNFLGIQCNIPKNPHYFLSINYGKDYMTNIVKPLVIHKNEQIL